MIRKAVITGSLVLSLGSLGLYVTSYLPIPKQRESRGFQFGDIYHMTAAGKPLPGKTRWLGYVQSGKASCELNKPFIDVREVFRCEIPFLFVCRYRQEAGVQPSLGGEMIMSGILCHISVHLWWPPLLFAVYPAVAFVRGPYRRYRRRRKGLCLKCGYDLTGNVSGTCPECGEKT